MLSDDSSVKKHERKVLLQLDELGLAQKSFSLPVTYCPHKAKKCHPRGIWTFEIDRALKNALSDVVLNRLNGKRYDSLKIKADKLTIKTIFEEIELDSAVKSFSYDTGSKEDFKNTVVSYLNNNIAPLMIRLLDTAKDARYQEMADKERETFLATIAKEESVPLKFIQKLMSSAYSFSVHLDRLGGSVSINQVERKDSKGRKYMVYDTSISISTNINLFIYSFNPTSQEFEAYSVVDGPSGFVSSSADFKYFPKKHMASGIFERAIRVATKASGIAINTELKEDDNFAIFATVDQLDDSEIKSLIGELEDLRIDAPYIIYQTQDGKREKMGWIKARSVASEKTYKESYANYYSDFELASGDVEIKDQLREHPWTGAFLYIGAAQNTVDVEEIDGNSAKGGGDFAGLNLGAKLDLGYMFNSPGFSETWVELNANLVTGGDDIEVGGNIYSDTSASSLSLDFVNRSYLSMAGMYWGYKFGFGGISIDGNTVAGSELKISAYSVNAGIQVALWSSPNTEFYTNFDVMVPFGANSKIDDGDELETTISPSVNITVGVAFHIRSLGSLAAVSN